jgi:hypothetical protein
MTSEQSAAYVYANSVAALVELEAMKAANFERQLNNESLAYNENTIAEIIQKYGIHHNAILSLFSQVDYN